MAGYIDRTAWKREEHFQLFSKMDYPLFNICAPLDITTFYTFVKQQKEPFFIAFLYLAVKAANRIEEFRSRVRADGIYLHDTVHPSFTVMGADDLFGFCYADFSEEYSRFKGDAVEAMENAKNRGGLDENVRRDDYLYITCIPWISFTSISHPVSLSQTDSVPRISWGKYEDREGRKWIPLSVSLHHGLADGFHTGRYFQLLQEYLDHPEPHLMT